MTPGPADPMPADGDPPGQPPVGVPVRPAANEDVFFPLPRPLRNGEAAE